jgi:2-desacetyl-2-hydroxyethyl bacteriochlorophyllide A dehydrogenase
MKALVLDGVNKLETREIPADQPKEDEYLIKVEAAGICGTDRHILHGTYPASYPVVLGHEFSGRIEHAPTLSKFKVGERVNINPNIACQRCAYCRMGLVNLCMHNIAHGVNRNGGLAQFAAIPETQLFKLPESIDPKFGAFCEPLACCIQAIDLAEINPGDKVAIIGGGIIGQLMVQLVKLSGAEVILLSTRQKFRREMAERLGATHSIDPSNSKSNDKFVGPNGVVPIGFDVVIECAGTKETLKQSLEIIRSGGSVILFGVMPQNEIFELSPFDIFVRQIRIQGVFTGSKVHKKAAEMISENKLDLSPLITQVIGLEEACERITGEPLSGEIKTIVLPNG